jgi:hypothetical protein
MVSLVIPPQNRDPHDYLCPATSPVLSGLGRLLPVVSAAVRILVLGGTSFVGRAIVEDALSTGAEVSLFGRGKTGADLFPSQEGRRVSEPDDYPRSATITFPG